MISAACASTASVRPSTSISSTAAQSFGKSGVDVILDRAQRESVQHLARGRSDGPHA